MTTIDLNSGQALDVIDLKRVGVEASHNTPLVLSTGRALDAPSGIKNIGELGRAMEGSTPLSYAVSAETPIPVLGESVTSGSMLGKAGKLGTIARFGVAFGVGFVASLIAGGVGNAILWSGKEYGSEKDKAGTAALFGFMPPAAIPMAVNARAMTDMVYEPIVRSFYYGNYQKQREANPQLTDQEFDRFWDERYDRSGYPLPWQLLPENQ